MNGKETEIIQDLTDLVIELLEEKQVRHDLISKLVGIRIKFRENLTENQEKNMERTENLCNIYSLSLNSNGHTLNFDANKAFENVLTMGIKGIKDELEWVKRVKLCANGNIFIYELKE